MTDTEEIEIIEIGSGTEDVEKSDESRPKGNICSFLRSLKEFCVDQNFVRDEDPHKDSDKFNAAITKANKEGNHEEIFDLIGPKSSLKLWSLVEVDSDVGSEGRQHTSLLGQMEEKMQRVKENLKDPAAKLLGSGKKKKTVFQALLDDVVNGNRILSKCLDDLISSPSNTKPDSEDFTLNIDFSGLIKTNSTKQCENLFDIVNKSKSGKICEKVYPIVRHPVIALFIWKKWRKAIWFFLINAVLYGIFLFNYTWLILQIFNNNAETENGTRNETCQNHPYQDGDIGKSGIGLLVSVVLLICWEIIQMIRLRLIYFKEIGNYIELFVSVTALLLLCDIKGMTSADDSAERERGEWERGIVAVGISLAWIELVFVTGKLGLITRIFKIHWISDGEFSIMFYNIITKIFKYIVIIVIVVFGFSLAFQVQHHCLDPETDVFQTKEESFMRALAMSLGEFDFSAYSETFPRGEGHTTRRVFAMTLLIGLIFFVSLTIYNLFIAVVISDVKDLQDAVFIQNIYNMIQLSYILEAIFPKWLTKRTIQIEGSEKFCVHDVCTRNEVKCGKRVPEEMKQVRDYLIKNYVDIKKEQ